MNASRYRDLSGMTEGTLVVETLAYRTSDGEPRYNVRCKKCGDQWIERYQRLSQGFLKQGCHNSICRLNKLPDSKISAHERWLSEPEPEPVTEPVPEPAPVKAVAPAPPDYRRYFTHAMKNSWTEVIPYGEWQTLPAHGRQWVLDRVAKEGG